MEEQQKRTFKCISCERDKAEGEEACCKRCYQGMIVQIMNKYNELAEYKKGADIELINQRLDYLSGKMDNIKEDILIIGGLVEKKFTIKLRKGS